MPLSNCTVFTGNDEDMSIIPFIKPQCFFPYFYGRGEFCEKPCTKHWNIVRPWLKETLLFLKLFFPLQA